jgi:hypothetical protein
MTTNREESSGRQIVAGALTAGVLVVSLGLYFAFRAPPQMGYSEDVLGTVDALFTAVTGHNEEALAQCEERLRAYRDSGTLPPAAAQRLDAVIHQCRSGAWEPAARELYTFIRGQRGTT